MRARTIFIVTLLGAFTAPVFGAEGDVRFYEQDGVTYRETRTVVRQPVSQTRVEQREQTVYRQRYSTEMRQTTQSVYTPVTQFYWEARWHGWWNPFQEPYVAYHAVPTTYWQTRQQTARVPVTQREMIPEKRTVRVPVTTLRFVEKEEVSRVAVSPRPAASPPPRTVRFTGNGSIGGIARLEGDPPRFGTAANASTGRFRR